ncbi:unnamed protein product [Protopolystoma xenopodis]|uniref:Uncharacterized protein n=1 Tax=Protopolystoma xenopodis TaxID=117903 RepID=A0A448X529_9PLAT|nr:unnamed protein product [Protopolystoma xenopodis]
MNWEMVDRFGSRLVDLLSPNLHGLGQRQVGTFRPARVGLTFPRRTQTSLDKPDSGQISRPSSAGIRRSD